jgi:hypothetical protein
MRNRFKSTLFLIISSALFLSEAQSQSPATKRADSLFAIADWKNAKIAYEAVLKDTTINAIAWNRLGFTNYNLRLFDVAIKNFEKSLSRNQPAGLKPIVYSRMAKIYALKKENSMAFTALDSAVNNGYSNYKELDSLSDFQSIRTEERFKKIREQVYINGNPCMADAQHRQFDFWVGEWNVFQTTGMVQTGAHSSIQMISGGCAILENWESPGSNGKSINFVDPVTHKWKQSWVGNYANGTQEFVNGEYKDGAMRFDFTTTGPKGQKIIGHLIFYNQSPNQVRQFNETSADDGKTWTTNYDFTYVRKK